VLGTARILVFQNGVVEDIHGDLEFLLCEGQTREASWEIDIRK
jgi:hypothetical protein